MLLDLCIHAVLRRKSLSLLQIHIKHDEPFFKVFTESCLKERISVVVVVVLFKDQQKYLGYAENEKSGRILCHSRPSLDIG